MAYMIEKIWEHKSNVCVVIMTDIGHRCGYVGINPDHPLYGEEYHSTPESIQNLKEKLVNSPVGKRGVMDLLTVDFEKGVRIGDLFDVHGSLTYSGGSPIYPITVWVELRWPSRSSATFYFNPWWFGYDCAHSGDGKDLSVISESLREIHLRFPILGEILRSLDYCISECESLSGQLEELNELERVSR